MWKDDNNKPKIVITKNDVYDKLTKLDGDIWIIDNVFSSKFCENIIAKFEADDRKAKGRTADLSLEEYKIGTDLLVSGLSGWEKDDEHLFKTISVNINELVSQLIAPFADDIIISFPFDRDTGYNIQRTNVGGYYKWHMDSGGYVEVDRRLAMLIYLNDKGLKGGGTQFQRQGTLVEPREGRMIMFPPIWTHVHAGNVLEEGIKYIIFTSFKPTIEELGIEYIKNQILKGY